MIFISICCCYARQTKYVKASWTWPLLINDYTRQPELLQESQTIPIAEGLKYDESGSKHFFYT